MAPQTSAGSVTVEDSVSVQPPMERLEVPPSQPPPEVPDMVTGHRARDAGRNHAEEFPTAGRGEHARAIHPVSYPCM